jgi:UDP-2,4-diacetamido-2,4,6-trideoxy-beta-L-altropyranose hydrolase
VTGPASQRGSPTAVFRADASLEIGGGHVARCRTLAAALASTGWRCLLVTRRLPRAIRQPVLAAGIEVLDLPDGVAKDAEPEWLADQAPGAALLVADGYGIDGSWLGQARAVAPLVMAIDDLADRALPVDIVLNQNLGASVAAYAGLVPADAQILAGPAFALLRPEFAAVRAGMTPRTGALSRALVFMSSGDPGDITRLAAEGATAAGLAVDIVVGGAYPHKQRLREWAAGRRDVRIHVATERMAELMAGADIAVGAPSSASWERCALGLPAVLITLAPNQVTVARHLVEDGAAVSLGWQGEVTSRDVARALEALAADPLRVRRMAVAAAGITDGAGTQRVARVIGEASAATAQTR